MAVTLLIMGKALLNINEHALCIIEEAKALSKAYEDKPNVKPNWSTIIAPFAQSALELAEKARA